MYIDFNYSLYLMIVKNKKYPPNSVYWYCGGVLVLWCMSDDSVKKTIQCIGITVVLVYWYCSGVLTGIVVVYRYCGGVLVLW